MVDKLYSSFSQTKGLLWKDKYVQILAGGIPYPVGAVIDLTDECNLNCNWCNAKHYRSANTLNTAEVENILLDLYNIGTKSVCFAGGGEPLLHSGFSYIIEYANHLGMEIGIATNGINLLEHADAIKRYARFCGVSIDTSSAVGWIKNKGGTAKQWKQMIKGVKELNKGSLDTTYKFLIVPENQWEIYLAAKKAKKLGFKNFFARPAAIEGVPAFKGETRGWKRINFDIGIIQERLEWAEELETKDFKVYHSFNRVDSKFKRIHKFNSCRATPLMAVFCADGYVYLCIDHRQDKRYRLCRNSEILSFWNTRKHRNILKKIDISKCPRCAFGNYNQQIEAYSTDYMFKNFP